MNKRIMLPMLLVAFVVSDATAQNRFHRRRGTVIGGIAGAAIGAAIGDDKGNAAGGAVIGGVVGAAAGNAIGGRRDRRVEGQYYQTQPTPAHGYSHGHPYQYQYQYGPAQQPTHFDRPDDWQSRGFRGDQVTTAVSMADVVTMVRSGLGERTIVEHIRINGVQRRLEIRDIIQLHDDGVSEPIIRAMQIAPVVVPESMTVPGPYAPSPFAPAPSAQPYQAGPHGRSILTPGFAPPRPVPPADPQPWDLAPAN